MMKNKFIASAIAATILSSGCSSVITKDVDKTVMDTNAKVSGAMDALRSGKPLEQAQDTSAVRHIDRSWVPVSQVNEQDQHAASFLSRNVVINRNFSGLQEAASYVTVLTGVPVSVAPQRTGAGMPQTPAGSPATAPITPPPSASPYMMQQPFAQFQQQGITVGSVSYNGALSGFLDIIAARYGVYWETEGDGIRFFYTKSKTFRIAALPGDSSMNSTVGTSSSGGSGGSSGGSSSSSSSPSKMDSGIKFDGLSVWKAIEDGIKTMLTQSGRVVVTPATGTITVDDTPPSLERIEKYVHQQNAALTKQVVLNVRVLSVELNDTDSYGINWNAVYQNLGRGFTATLASASGLPTGTAASLSFNIVNTNSMWDGTQAMIEALSTQGRVSQITSASVVTINNQPAPIQVGRQRSYLASSTTTIGTGGAGNTTTLVPGVVTTGFSLSVLPHILDNGRLMMQYAGDISSLLDITTVSSNGSSIQTPEIDTRNFLQRVMMNNGETLVLTGFEQFGVSGMKSGIGSADNMMFGGSVRKENNKTVLVVLIQPVITAGDR
jgi:type IVB pilus formation R64 PilN family outer membrane protein